MEINNNQAIQILSRFNDYIQEHQIALNEWDDAGDGDHGTHMSFAMHKVMQSLDRNSYDTPHAVFKQAATVFEKEGSGYACALYAKAFEAMALCDDIICLSQLLEKSAESLQSFSSAKLHDKTMIDVWLGVLELYETNRFEKDLIQAIPQRTKEMVARQGQASQNPSMSQSLLDPGSMSTMYLMLSFADVLYV